MGPHKDLLTSAVNEVLQQCEYADVAYSNIQNKQSNIVFSSIHSFLSHCSVISRFLWENRAIKDKYRQSLAEILELDSNMQIRSRKFRDDFDHFDERLPIWLEGLGNENIFDSTVSDQRNFVSLEGSNAHFLRHFIRSENVYVFMDNELNLAELHEELHKISNTISDSMSRLEAARASSER